MSASATAASIEFGVDGLGAESADRSAQQLGLAAAEGNRLLGAEPEQVLLAGPQQGAGVGSVVAQGQSAHHRDRDAGQLALHQVGRRGDLVGDGDLGDEQFVAVPVVRPGVAVQHRQARGADGGVGLAVAPGPAHGVGDDHADGDARAARASPDRSAAALASGSTGSRASSAESTLEPSTPAAAWISPMRVLGDQRPALAGEYPYGFVVDELAAQGIPLVGVGRRGDDAALALGHHLAGDHHDVVVAQPRRRRGDGRGEVVAGPELGKPGHRQHLDGGGRAVLASRPFT